ncbi:DUF3106 domain-containing protein [Rivibacter subsaxonicus]|uniref:Uncharacterized protein DUF3106 n=1 Tax=Rivibacter subsaxonicus TaxID=457575 RepID=A0A4Q7W1P7_9BURK|nr:DUF3106 domain-containing protein [Rivibacter subsaxonicus]RZU03080.1 uncharacterized protein DUF3106 [Rivibacter subsaxonicus]
MATEPKLLVRRGRPTLYALLHRCVLLLALAQLAPVVTAAEAGPSWASLSPQQRTALAPLARDWGSIDAQRKLKWLEVAARFDQLSPAERERIQDRMSEWARMTPAERGQARLNYQGAKQLSAEDRQARWEAYQALPEEQRRKLASQSAQKPAATTARPPVGARAAGPAASAAGTATTGGARAAAPVAAPQRRPVLPPGETRPKVNTVPDPQQAAKPQTVAPTVVQAKPGASTRLITQTPTPPSHQQAGMPKIAATSEFVDRKTLLPQRGPQSAVAEARAASAPGAAGTTQR